MNGELEQLLEARAEGRLDEPGRRRLDELCAGDPSAAELRGREERLEAMLGRLGASHAPPGLARSVFDRMERIEVGDRAARRRKSASLWDRLAGAWRLPQVRWATAGAVTVLAAVNVGLLLRPRLVSTPGLTAIEQYSRGHQGAEQQVAKVFVPNLAPPQADPVEQPNRPPKENVNRRDIQIASVPKPVPTERPVAPSADGLRLSAQATPDALPESPRVGLQLVLAKMESAAASGEAAEHHNIPLKAIEKALAEAGGQINSREWVNGRDVWEIQTAMTPDQLSRFTRTLENLGVKSNAPMAAEPKEEFESYFKVTDGSRWLEGTRGSGGGSVSGEPQTQRQQVQLMLTVDFVMFDENIQKLP